MSAPRWTQWLLRRLAPRGVTEDVLGDLEELHGRRLQRHGRLKANLLTTMEALDLALALLRLRRLSAVNARKRNVAPAQSESRPVGGSAVLSEPLVARGLNSTFPETIVRESGSWHMRSVLEAWVNDFVLAGRSLRRAPVFTVITVATLALAIGSNAAIFSVVDTVLLDALPFPNADRLVHIRGAAPGSDVEGEIGVADELYVQYRESADRLEDAGLYSIFQSTASAGEQIDRLFMTLTTPSLFSTLGVTPALGRLPTADDDEDAVVISHSLWRNWFGSDAGVIGSTLVAAGRTRTVIGVMRTDFQFPDERVSIWVPWLIQPAQLTAGGFNRDMVARMTPGTDHAALSAQLTPLARRLLERFPGPPPYARVIENHRPIVRSLEEQLVGNVAGPLWILLGTVGIILLIACANVANLFMVRAESRRSDLAVRRALGAGRGGLIRVQMAEALLLAAVGGAGGVLIAWAAVPLLVRAAPEGIPRLGTVTLDLTTLAFTASVSILAACAFGLAPAIRLSGMALLSTLRQAGRGVVGGRHLGRDALVVVQTASALTLLVASALLVRSFLQLSSVDPGFDKQDIFTFQIAPSSAELRDGPSYARFHLSFMERVAALPGVESVGVVQELPLDEGAAASLFATDRTEASGVEGPVLRFSFTGGDYFQAMGIRLLRGRSFDLSDQVSGAPNAIVSRSTAERLWPGEDPLGKRLRPNPVPNLWWTVIGVVEDVMLSNFRQQNADPMVYFPLVGPTPALYAIGSPAYVVKTSRARTIATDIRALVRQAAPESPMYRIFTMEGLAARSMAQLSFTMLMLAIAAALALILGAVGIYGVLSYVVSQRTREIGIRMALGAEARMLRRMVVLQGGRVTLLGVGIGVVAALLLTRVLKGLLFGIDATDAPTFLAMAAVMLAVALLASYIPARRASSVDPMRSLRAE